MSELGFFDAVSYGKDECTLLGTVDSLFYLGNTEVTFAGRTWTLGNKKAELTSFTRQQVTFVTDESPSWLSIALKILAFCTVVIPLLMLPLKYALRKNYKFEVVPHNYEMPLEQRLDEWIYLIIHGKKTVTDIIDIIKDDASLAAHFMFRLSLLDSVKGMFAVYAGEISIWHRTRAVSFLSAQDLSLNTVWSQFVSRYPDKWVNVFGEMAIQKPNDPFIQKQIVRFTEEEHQKELSGFFISKFRSLPAEELPSLIATWVELSYDETQGKYVQWILDDVSGCIKNLKREPELYVKCLMSLADTLMMNNIVTNNSKKIFNPNQIVCLQLDRLFNSMTSISDINDLADKQLADIQNEIAKQSKDKPPMLISYYIFKNKLWEKSSQISLKQFVEGRIHAQCGAFLALLAREDREGVKQVIHILNTDCPVIEGLKPERALEQGKLIFNHMAELLPKDIEPFEWV